jgi:hypothetical protein
MIVYILFVHKKSVSKREKLKIIFIKIKNKKKQKKKQKKTFIVVRHSTAISYPSIENSFNGCQGHPLVCLPPGTAQRQPDRK